MVVEIFLILFIAFAVVVGSRVTHTRTLWTKASKCVATTSWSPLLKSSNVQTNQKFLSKEVKAYKLPPLQRRTSTRMGMGLKRVDESNWLTIDSNYLPEHKERCHLLETSRPQVIQCLQGSEAACHEVLELVSNFLSSRFPQCFTVKPSPRHTISNHITGETFPMGLQCPNPLETVAKLAMEDFNILMKDPSTGEYLLQASVTLFPAGWILQERIGTSMANLHGPVPGWQEKLGASVDKYFNRLSPRTPVERYNLFIQTTPSLFADDASFQQAPTLSIEDISVRRERQTFMRLEKSDAVLFTVRTYMQPLTELAQEEIEGLVSQIESWEGEMGVYKGVQNWGHLVLGWCREQMGRDIKKA